MIAQLGFLDLIAGVAPNLRSLPSGNGLLSTS